MPAKDGKNDESWHVALQCSPTPVRVKNVPVSAATPSPVQATTTYTTTESAVRDVETAEIADGELGALRRETLPWGHFLPIEKNATTQSRIRAPGRGSDFSELLEEGKKRLEHAEKDELLRGRAEVVGRMGGGALDDVLIDLHEPTFSRRQNERLRQGIATKLRTKVARMFGRVMCEYFSGSDPARRAEEDSLARATARFRVNLQRLLNKTNLGEVQKQVAREIEGRTGTPTTRIRRRCCINMHETENIRRETPRKGAGSKSRSASATTKIGTATSRLTKPRPPPKQACAAVPTLRSGSAHSGRAGASPHQPSSTRLTVPRAIRQEGSGKSARRENRCHTGSSVVGEIEQNHVNDLKSEAPLDAPGSLNEAEICRGSSGTSPIVGRSTDGSSSGESVDFYDGLGEGSDDWCDSERIGGDSELSSTSEESAAGLRAADTCQEEQGGRESAEEGEEEARSPPAEKNGSTKRRQRGRKFDRHRKGVDGDRDAKMRNEINRPQSGIALNEAWSVRSLTVLLKEFGLYQPCQRTVLSNHLPAECAEDAEEGKTRGLPPPPPPRIDRPHFTPAFVELPAVGKGRTLLMCPEPVAPGYDFSDVFAEVVKMHAPVGQLILEDIERGNVVTRSDALAHAAHFENDSNADQGKLLVAEFLADDDVGDALASAAAMELDLALCAEAGTLFDLDMP